MKADQLKEAAGSYNRFPDEKGTENCNGRSDLRIATRYSKPFMVDFRIT